MRGKTIVAGVLAISAVAGCVSGHQAHATLAGTDSSSKLSGTATFTKIESSVKAVIQVANRRGKYIGICGQAPSDYPEFAQFLVEAGIQSISLNPDTVLKTTLKIAETEKRLGISPK